MTSGDLGIASGVLVAAGVCGVCLLYLRLRRRRRALLARTAELLGARFHGLSFRGRFRGRAVRGDAVPRLRRSPTAEVPTVVTAILQGASGVLSELWALANSASDAWRVLRVRVELSAAGARDPDPAAAVAAVRRELEARLPEPGNCDVAATGSELTFILRARAAEAELARELVQLAVSAAEAGAPGDSVR